MHCFAPGMGEGGGGGGGYNAVKMALPCTRQLHGTYHYC